MEEKKLTLTKRSESYKIVIPESVEKTIRFLCSQVWSTEWSGVLFYKHTGSFEDNNLEIHCVDIFPMDIGSSTYTEFNMSPDVITYMTENPELLECQTGLVHSHCTFSTFFSGTDQSTLKEEGSDKNHFVSLIVNNEGKYTAGITRKIKYTEKRDISYYTFDGKQVVTNEEFEEAEEIEWFNLNIVFEKPTEKDKFQTISDRLSLIKEEKKKIEASKKLSSTTSIATTTNLYKPQIENKVWGTGASIKEKSLFDEYDDDFDFKEWNKSFGVVDDVPSDDMPKAVTDSIVENAAAQLLTGCILATKKSILNLDSWMDTMESRFDARFGKDDKNLISFTSWATSFIEFIVWYSIDDDILDKYKLMEDECAVYLSEKLIEYLKSIKKQNKYIKEYIDLLKDYDKFR